METFKIVVDGIEIDEKRRKEIEANLEKAFLETLRLQAKDFRIQPLRPAKSLIKRPLINGIEIMHRLAEQQEVPGEKFNRETGPGGSLGGG
jgi:hypothetical protein